MRVLLLFRGSAGCGKSTYIEQHGLKPFTLCADDIRLMCSTPSLTVDGNVEITQKNDRVVWKTLFNILETRMKNGGFTVIDATNSKTAEMNQYKELAKAYRYRIYCIDMTDIPIEETKRRNRQRPILKQVPDEVIDKFYSRFENQNIPAGIKVLRPDELDTIWYRPMDLSSYKKIHVIGDIHGCYTALKEYIERTGGLKSDEMYIFCGDYIDRGIENAEVVDWICEQINYPNIIFLEGNHERWLWMWSNDLVTKSSEFELNTRPQLLKNNISKKKVREFYRRLCQVCYFTYGKRKVIITHGGISNIPNNLLEIATEQMIKGVGKYGDSDLVDESFMAHTDENTYQIHGHRNVTNSGVMTTDRTCNLEGQVEFGGYLRAVQITHDYIIPVEIKNDVFKDPTVAAEEEKTNENVDMTVYGLVQQMRLNFKNIHEKAFGRISSFNFTRQAFESANWDDITNKARGLYIDTQNYQIVARAYDKFFNINERPETRFGNLQHKLQFPVTAYLKENGFLGIVGWNTETDDLLITSKSDIGGIFAGYLRTLLYSIYGESKMQKIKEYIRDNNVSFVFECCDVEHDLHIIEYKESKVVLLDIVKNQLQFEKLPYDELVKIANEIGLVVKEKAFVLDTWEDFYAWYQDINAEDYEYKNEKIEGFVIEDSVGYMTKLKLHYYKYWKRLRSVAQSVFKYGNYKYTGSLLTPIENEFYGWCKSLATDMTVEERKEYCRKYNINICQLRNEFFKWRESKEDNVGSKQTL